MIKQEKQGKKKDNRCKPISKYDKKKKFEIQGANDDHEELALMTLTPSKYGLKVLITRLNKGILLHCINLFLLLNDLQSN